VDSLLFREDPILPNSPINRPPGPASALYQSRSNFGGFAPLLWGDLLIGYIDIDFIQM
jgi:hypothetical protein